MALVFPSNRNDYLGSLRFIPEAQTSQASESGEGEVVPERNESEQIELYLPSSLQIGDKVEYENVGLGALFGSAVDAINSETVSYDQLLGNTNFGDVAKLGVQKAVALFSDKGAAAARLATKTAPNPNTRAIFKQVNLRTFQFTFKFIPNNADEAETISRIIKEFRTNMYPESVDNLAYKFPTRYIIEAMYDGMTLMNYNILTEPCYLESVMTNYNPTSQTFMKKQGSFQPYFSEIDMSLTFIEGKTLDKESVRTGGL